MRSRSSIPISPCLLSVYLCLYVYILMSKPQSISLCRVYRCVHTCRRGIHAVYHFCMKLACGRTASQHALAHSPWLSTPQTSTRTCTQVIFHSHCSTGALGAQLRHPCRATWHESAVKAYPGTPLGASWRAPARSPSTQNTRHTCRHTWPCRAARACISACLARAFPHRQTIENRSIPPPNAVSHNSSSFVNFSKIPSAAGCSRLAHVDRAIKRTSTMAQSLCVVFRQRFTIACSIGNPLSSEYTKLTPLLCPDVRRRIPALKHYILAVPLLED